MSYQTGAASSSTDVLQKLITWLVSIGWTQDRSAAEGSGWTISAHKSGNYAHLRACENENTPWSRGFGGPTYGLNLYLGTGFNGSNLWNNQAGAPLNSVGGPMGVGAFLSAGPFSNYYFFADSSGDNIVVVIEKTPGLFVHLGWGLSINKQGTFTGGPYFFGSSCSYYTSYTAAPANTPGFSASSDCPGPTADQIGGACAFVRADVDSFTGNWIGIFTGGTGLTASDFGYTGKLGSSSVHAKQQAMQPSIPCYAVNDAPLQFQFQQVSAQDSRANLLPVLLWVERDGTTTGFSPLGDLPNVFCTDAVGNGFSNAEEYVIGSTTYKLFPNFAVVKQ